VSKGGRGRKFGLNEDLTKVTRSGKVDNQRLQVEVKTKWLGRDERDLALSNAKYEKKKNGGSCSGGRGFDGGETGEKRRGCCSSG